VSVGGLLGDSLEVRVHLGFVWGLFGVCREFIGGDLFRVIFGLRI
jgi:hypothetical protein